MAAQTKSHTALITGGAAGLGLAFAEALLKSGIASQVCILDLYNAEKTAQALQTQFPSSSIFGARCDVCDLPALAAAFDWAADCMGGREFTSRRSQHSAQPPSLACTTDISIVVNNAGIVADEFDAFSKVIDVNVTAVIAGTKLAFEHMSASGRADGVIINVASFGGLVPMPFNPVYAASKAAVVHFSRSCEYMANGGGGGSKGPGTARVYALCPGFSDTAMVTGGLAAGAKGLDMAVSMQGGVLSPQWVADHLLELVANPKLRAGGHLLALPQASYFRRKPVEVPVRVSSGKTVPLAADGKL